VSHISRRINYAELAVAAADAIEARHKSKVISALNDPSARRTLKRFCLHLNVSFLINQVFHHVLELLLATGAFELAKLHTYANKSSEEK
jgi:hypothetical protein